MTARPNLDGKPRYDRSPWRRARRTIGPARQPVHRPASPWRIRLAGTAGRPPASGLDPVRRRPRLQPDPAAARSARAQPPVSEQHGDAHRTLVLLPADLEPVSLRFARRVRVPA